MAEYQSGGILRGNTARRAITRRRFLQAGAAGLALSSAVAPARFAIAQGAPVKVGIMLPYTGVYAKLGENITDAFLMRIAEAGGKLGGRDVEYHKLDSEAAPPKAVDNATKLVKGREVEFIVGPVHSGVAMGMTKVMSGAPKTIMICPNAGLNELTREICAANIFRTSFSNWQTGYAMGAEFVRRGHKRVVTAAWNYAAGHQIVGGFLEGFAKAGGGAPAEQLWPPFEDVEFQVILTRIAALKPDAVFVFFAGGGAVKFVKDYDAAIDRKQIPLYGPGFITDGTLEAQGAAAEGIVTTLHWADTLDIPANRKFMTDFQAKLGRPADVYAVQGYDTGSLMVQAMAQVKGDTGATKELVTALEKAQFPDSPRGSWRMSRSHNPIQDFYLRRVDRGRNVVVGVAHAQLEDPGTGCKL